MVRKHESGATQGVSMVGGGGGGGNGSVLHLWNSSLITSHLLMSQVNTQENTAALLTCAGSPLIMCHPEVAASAAGAALVGLTHYRENTTSANQTLSHKKGSPSDFMRLSKHKHISSVLAPTYIYFKQNHLPYAHSKWQTRICDKNG